MKERFDIMNHEFEPMDLATALQEALAQVSSLTGGFHRDTNGPSTETYLTCVITNGRVMVAHQGGKELYYSTHKSVCPERDTCPFLSTNCERSAQLGESVNHLIISSEPLLGENVWNEMAPGELVFVDQQMTLGRHGEYGMAAARI
jgi:glutamine amidotransferase